jgi:Raf kinase inhibitor-like YbhB/YbcL family protein
MKLWSQSFEDGQPIPGEYAFCVADPKHHVKLSANRNPHLAWEDVPAGTQSLVLICHDPDVPSHGEDVNQEGREVPADLARVDFFHWVLIDLPPAVNAIEAGSCSKHVTPHGKGGPLTMAAGHEVRHGINDYTGWFAGDHDMEGSYFGYDGPCPPWNDSIVHRYVFTLHALDVPRLAVEGNFSGQDVRRAMQGHVLAEASFVGTYTLNPRLAG